MLRILLFCWQYSSRLRCIFLQRRSLLELLIALKVSELPVLMSQRSFFAAFVALVSGRQPLGIAHLNDCPVGANVESRI